MNIPFLLHSVWALPLPEVVSWRQHAVFCSMAAASAALSPVQSQSDHLTLYANRKLFAGKKGKEQEQCGIMNSDWQLCASCASALVCVCLYFNWCVILLCCTLPASTSILLHLLHTLLAAVRYHLTNDDCVYGFLLVFHRMYISFSFFLLLHQCVCYVQSNLRGEQQQ